VKSFAWYNKAVSYVLSSCGLHANRQIAQQTAGKNPRDHSGFSLRTSEYVLCIIGLVRARARFYVLRYFVFTYTYSFFPRLGTDSYSLIFKVELPRPASRVGKTCRRYVNCQGSALGFLNRNASVDRSLQRSLAIAGSNAPRVHSDYRFRTYT